MSRTSSVTWELIIIAGILLILPLSMVFAGGVFSEGEESESFFSPTKIEDFNDNAVNLLPYASYIRYAYENETSDFNAYDDTGLYTINQTGNEYHTHLLDQDPEDDSSFSEFRYWEVQVNKSTSDCIDDDLDKVAFEVEAPRNASYDIRLRFATDEDSDRYTVATEENVSLSNEMEKIEIDVEYSKLLDADNSLDENSMRIRLDPYDDAEGSEDLEALQPGDALKFNIDLMSSYTASPLITTNFFAGLMGGLSLMAGIFTSPWVDFKDVAGPIIGVIR